MNENNPCDGGRWLRHPSSCAEYFIEAPAGGDGAATDDAVASRFSSSSHSSSSLRAASNKCNRRKLDHLLFLVANHDNNLTVFLSLSNDGLEKKWPPTRRLAEDLTACLSSLPPREWKGEVDAAGYRLVPFMFL